MAYDDRAPKGIGGWLAFFILVITVFGPLRSIYLTYSNLYNADGISDLYGANWTLVQVVEWSIVVISTAICLNIGWRLYAVHVWRSVQLTIAALWLVSPVAQLLDVATVAVFSGESFVTLLLETSGSLVRPMLSAAIWTGYLLLSKRVANTYARHPDTVESSAVFD